MGTTAKRKEMKSFREDEWKKEIEARMKVYLCETIAEMKSRKNAFVLLS